MQAVVALCHFCENHGPRIVMTCQPMKNPPTRRKISKNEEDSQKLPNFYGEGIQNEIVDQDPRCAACSSFGSGLGLVSNDHDAKISYFSTQLPINERVYEIVKATCMRSLSIEISTPLYVDTSSSILSSVPSTSSQSSTKAECKIIKEINDSEHSGVVLYGDHENGYTLSYTFKLRDAKARGFQRLYAFLVITADEMLLLNHYDFFLNGFSAIIKRLQDMSAQTFEMEQSETGEVSMETAVNRMMFLPQNFFNRKFSLDTSRSLTMIVNDNGIFHVLHRQMLFLLRTQTTLVKDIVLEGVPTQDMLVAIERDPESLEESDLITSMTTIGTRFHIRNLQIIAWRFLELDQRYLTSLIWTIIVGDQLIVKSDDPSARKFFLLAIAHLLPIGCVKIASNATNCSTQYKNNFLGCNLDMEIPLDRLENTFIVSLKAGSSVASKNDLDSFEFNVENCPMRQGIKPKLLNRYTELLSDRSIGESVVESAIKSTRSEWLNRAKILFQLSRQREKIDLDRVLRTIRCETQDSPILLFFQAGLSQCYRQIVLNTIFSSIHQTAKHFPPIKKPR